MGINQTLLAQFRALDGPSQEKLLELLQVEFEGNSRVVENVRSELRDATDRPSCFHCGHSKVFKRGLRKGVRQFSCAECKKWFSENSGTVLHGIHHPEKWQEYVRLMQEGGTIKGIARQMGISIETSFRWRHKILSALGEREVSKLGDIVECDEMEFVMNNKGEDLERPARKRSTDANKPSHKSTTRKVKVLVAVDRQGSKYARVVEAGRINAKHVQKTVGKKLKKGSTLITDKHSAFLKYAKGLKTIKHIPIKAGDQKASSDKDINIQRVNQTHKQIRDFMRKFNGGVGTKYLQNYLNWYLYQTELKQSTGKLRMWVTIVLTSTTGLEFYNQIRSGVVNIVT